MTEDHHRMSPDARRARDAVMALSHPEPGTTYRERVKRAFVDGTIAPPTTSRPLPLPWWRSRPLAAVLLPAAAALVVVTALGLNRGPAWQIVSTSGDGIVVVDGRPVPVGHREDLGHALRGGARIELPAGVSIEIAAAGQMAMEVTASSRVTLPATAGRWFGRHVQARVGDGEIRITTGRSFHGGSLAVETPEADVVVTGTTLAVIREPHGTCVCVMEGVVHVGARGSEMVAVAAGHRRFVFVDGRAPEHDAMREGERVRLGQFRAQHQARMEGP